MITSAFIGLSAHALNMASVHVGESATFNLSIGGDSNAYTLKMEVTAVDAAAGTFTETQTIYKGTTQVQQSAMPPESIADMDQYAQIVDNCASAGGTPESVTVPAGTFQTCHILGSDNDGGKFDLQIAKVPFGIAILTQTGSDSKTLHAELTSFLN